MFLEVFHKGTIALRKLFVIREGENGLGLGDRHASILPITVVPILSHGGRA
jgi:hypothetical protein